MAIIGLVFLFKKSPISLGLLSLLTGCSAINIKLWENPDLDNDGVRWDDEPADCDDNDPDRYPGATDIPYDGIDQDCSDNDLTDVDGDGHDALEVDGDGHDALEVDGDDCDDNNPEISPDVSENYTNEIDDNCDGLIDDQDEDGYSITNGMDCNDTNEDINPGETELCNGVDDNCDGTVDEDLTATYYEDQDADLYGNAEMSIEACAQPTGYVTNSNDCDDTNSDIHPDAEDVADNGIDENCSGSDAHNSSFNVTRVLLGIPGWYASEELKDVFGTATFSYDATGGSVLLGVVDIEGYSNTLGATLDFYSAEEVEGSIASTDGSITLDPTTYTAYYVDPDGTLGTLLCDPDSKVMLLQTDMPFTTGETDNTFGTSDFEDMENFNISGSTIIGSALGSDLTGEMILVGSVVLTSSNFIEASPSASIALDGEVLFVQLVGTVE